MQDLTTDFKSLREVRVLSRFLPIVFLTGGVARAELLPALKAGLVPQGVSVIDEQDQKQDLRQILVGPQPVLLLPVFTKCLGSCPVMVHALKKALQQPSTRAPFRVVIFDFDSGDRAADLKRFRQEVELPADWIFVRSSADGATRDFFDQFDYHFMREGGGFNHPNQAFILSAQGKWTGIWLGSAYSASLLKTGFDQAFSADHPNFASRVSAILGRTENWVLFGMAGFLVGLVVVAAIFVRYWSRRTRPS